MKGNNINRMRSGLLTVALISLFASCIKEDMDYIPGANERTEIEFTLKLPNNGSTATRALTPAEEDAVEDIRLLVFQPNGGTYEYIVIPTPVTGVANRYVAKLSTGNCDLVLLVNSAEHIGNIFGSSVPSTTTLLDFTSQLQVSLTGKWNADSGSPGYMAIPMWAYKENVTIAQNTSFIGENDNFKLLRMLARINVSVADAAQQKFKLTSVSVYNRQDKGQIVPVLGNLNAAMTISESPSFASGASQIKGPLRYDGTAIKDQKECLNEIYVFEAPAGIAANFPAYPCIVVGGTYEGVAGYYRIDFAKQTGTQLDYLPLTRNKTYEVTINSVSAPGYNTDENAYTARPVNIEAEVIEWNDGGVNAWTDGQYLLTIDPGKFFFYRAMILENEGQNRMKIWTDHPQGWTFEGIEYEGSQTGWLEFMGGDTGPNAGQSYDRWLKVAANNGTGSRSANVLIQAGRIKAKVKVTQTDESEIYIRIYIPDTKDPADAEYKFRRLPWEDVREEFMVEWGPADADVSLRVEPVAKTDGGNYDPLEFIGDAYVNAIISGAGNNYNENINTIPFNIVLKNYRDQANEAQSRGEYFFPNTANEYVFTVVYKDRSVRKNLKIEYEYLDAQSSWAGKTKRLLQNREHQLPITMNTRVKVLLEGDDIFTTAAKNNISKTFSPGTSTRIYYGLLNCMTKNNEAMNGKSCWIVYSDPVTGKEFRRFQVKSNYQHSNCYLVPMGQTKVNISIGMPFYVWEEMIGEPIENITLTSRLLWEDRPGLVEKVEMDINPDDPENSLLNVTLNPGQSGNASVALCGYGQDGIPQVLWSWHIWVTTYDPSTDYVTMNREGQNGGPTVIFNMMSMNLGATITTLSDPWSNGYYYQWGRKDPFPPRSTIPDGGNWITNRRTTYNEERSFSGQTAPSISSSNQNNLKNSIRNPNIFYQDAVDWYIPGTGGESSLFLWNDDRKLKGIFDPCPEGWTLPGVIVGLQSEAHWYLTPSFESPTGQNTYGFTFDGSHGFAGKTTWPKGGYINGSDLTWTSMNEALIWRNLTYGTTESMLDRTRYDMFRIHTYAKRCHGMQVRCIEDKKWWVVDQ